MSNPFFKPQRRGFMGGLVGLCCLACGRPARSKSSVLEELANRGGCTLQAGDLDEIESAAGAAVDYGGKSAIPSSGDPVLDRALGAALVRITQTFGERPGFAFYDDSRANNAYATTDTRVDGTWGTVLFGRTMFWNLVRENDDQGMSTIAVLAHEMGHVVQFHRGLNKILLKGQKTVKRNELHADYLSGYYLGTLKRVNPNISLLFAGAMFRSLGDMSVNSRDHHGTPDERIMAAERGFTQGFDGDTLDDAIAQGMRYVIATF
jgi:hypothetical protein